MLLSHVVLGLWGTTMLKVHHGLLVLKTIAEDQSPTKSSRVFTKLYQLISPLLVLTSIQIFERGLPILNPARRLWTVSETVFLHFYIFFGIPPSLDLEPRWFVKSN